MGKLISIGPSSPLYKIALVTKGVYLVPIDLFLETEQIATNSVIAFVFSLLLSDDVMGWRVMFTWFNGSLQYMIRMDGIIIWFDVYTCKKVTRK